MKDCWGGGSGLGLTDQALRSSGSSTPKPRSPHPQTPKPLSRVRRNREAPNRWTEPRNLSTTQKALEFLHRAVEVVVGSRQ